MAERWHTIRMFTVAAWTGPGSNELTGIDFPDATNVPAVVGTTLTGAIPAANDTVAVVCNPDEAELVLGVVRP